MPPHSPLPTPKPFASSPINLMTAEILVSVAWEKKQVEMQLLVNLFNYSIRIICIDWKCWLLWMSVSCEFDRTQYFCSSTDACEIEEWYFAVIILKKRERERIRIQQYAIWLNFSLPKWLTTSDTFSWEITNLANKI